MAGLYNRTVDPNFVAPSRSAQGANAGIGAPGAAGLPRAPEDNFDPAQLAGLLGMLAKQKEAEGAAPDAAAPAQDAFTGSNQMNLAAPEFMNGMAQNVQGAGGVPIPQMPADGGYQLPQGALPGADMLQGVQGAGAAAPGLLGNFGSGIPAAGPAQLPVLDLSFLNGFGMGGMGGAG